MCTGIRFIDTEGNMYFGRNLDWTQSYGERVVATPPAAKIPAAFDRPDDLAKGHAVIGMGIIVAGIPLYFDCGNDAGLAVAGLNFPQSAHYATEGKADSINVAAYEFPFWIARNFASVKEACKALSKVTIVAKPVNEHLPVANLHWLISDASESIVVEYMKDGLHIWENNVDVLTNEPDFGWQYTNLRNYLTLTDNSPAAVIWNKANLAPFGSGVGMQGIPGDYSGPARFIKAAFVNSHYPVQIGETANITRLFRTLGSVAVPDGCAKMADGSYEKTLYTSCFSPSTMTYYHATYDDPQIRCYPLSSVDISKSDPVFVPSTI